MFPDKYMFPDKRSDGHYKGQMAINMKAKKIRLLIHDPIIKIFLPLNIYFCSNKVEQVYFTNLFCPFPMNTNMLTHIFRYTFNRLRSYL